MLPYRYSYKNSCFRELAHNSSVLVLMICSLKFEKDVVILKMLLWILCFWFEAMLHPSCYLTSVMNKTHHRLVAALFVCSFSSFFSYVGCILVTNHFSLLLIDGYILAIHQIIIQGGFAILLLIFSDLLDCLRSIGTMVITTESG